MPPTLGYGFVGSVLSVDLSTGEGHVEPLGEELTRKYVGGHGINVKLLYDRVPPNMDPLSPGSPIVIGAGALLGTLAPTAARTVIMGKSPVTGFIGISNAGHFGVMLKYAGYDHLVITGRADRPVYLEIDDDRVQLRDASHLWGKDTYETVDILWRERGNDYWVACIGPAGENLVPFAAVIGNKYAAFGRSGMGAVMGSKNLKAIAVRGTKGVRVADVPRFIKVTRKVLRRMMDSKEEVEVWRSGGTWGWSLKGHPFVRARAQRDDVEVLDPAKYYRKRFEVRNASCFACPIGCKHSLTLKEGKYPGMAFTLGCTSGTMSGPYGTGLGIVGYDDVARCAELVQRYGLDSITTGGLIYLATELYKNEMLGPQDTGGLHLEFGDAPLTHELIRQIAYREGLGSALAAGPVDFAKTVGRGAEEYVVHWKGLARAPTNVYHDLRAFKSTLALAWAVNPRGGHIDAYRFPWVVGSTEDAISIIRKWAQHIGMSQEDLDSVVHGDAYDMPGYMRFVERYNLSVYTMGLCDRTVVLKALPVDLLAELYSSATGLAISPQEMLIGAERIWNLQKAFNLRQGHTRKDDAVPERFFLESGVTSDGKVYPPLRREEFDQLIDRYYESHGWERETGKPRRETLVRLGLEDVADHVGAT